MSRAIAPFGLRIPPDLRHQIEEAAHDNRRSMNAEIVARLQASFEKAAGELVIKGLTPDQTELLKKVIETLEAKPKKGKGRR